jgi:hypothetical protein
MNPMKNNLTSGGFKAITPASPEQLAKLNALPTNRVAAVQPDGRVCSADPAVAKRPAL